MARDLDVEKQFDALLRARNTQFHLIRYNLQCINASTVGCKSVAHQAQKAEMTMPAFCTRVEEVMSANLLFKEATVKKKAGDIEGAIILLREAYAEMEKSGEAGTIDQFFRLPSYLSIAGRKDEGWRELHQILNGRYRVLGLGDAKTAPMIHAKIYEQMAKFLGNDGPSSTIARCELMAYLCWGIGLARQSFPIDDVGSRIKEFKKHISNVALDEVVDQFSEQTGNERSKGKVIAVLKRHWKDGPMVSLEQAMKDLEEALL